MVVKTVALIPARGGSKGIPRKNIKILCRKPLICWTIEAAKRSKCFDKIFVSTDDKEIAEIAIKYGAEVPFLRPKKISKDSTPGIFTALHLMEKVDGFDALCLLQPTSPLRTYTDIKNLIEFSKAKQANSVVSISKVKKHPFWMVKKNKKENILPLFKSPVISRRQNLPEAYFINGSMYFANKDWLKINQNFITKETFGFITPHENSIDIDDYDDFNYSEYMLKKRISVMQLDKRTDL